MADAVGQGLRAASGSIRARVRTRSVAFMMVPDLCHSNGASASPFRPFQGLFVGGHRGRSGYPCKRRTARAAPSNSSL